MSTADVLYLRTKLSEAEVAREIASRLGGKVESMASRSQRVGLPGLAEFSGWIGVNVRSVQPQTAGLRDITGTFDIQASVHCYIRREEVQLEAARVLMRDFIVKEVRWPAVLVHEFAWVAAAFHPLFGYIEYPAGALSMDSSIDAVWPGEARTGAS
jgi:hypothetical protein